MALLLVVFLLSSAPGKEGGHSQYWAESWRQSRGSNRHENQLDAWIFHSCISIAWSGGCMFHAWHAPASFCRTWQQRHHLASRLSAAHHGSQDRLLPFRQPGAGGHANHSLEKLKCPGTGRSEMDRQAKLSSQSWYKCQFRSERLGHETCGCTMMLDWIVELKRENRFHLPKFCTLDQYPASIDLTIKSEKRWEWVSK